MKKNKKLKGLIAILVIFVVLFCNTSGFAAGLKQKIDVVLNGITVKVNGAKLNSTVITYKGVTYVQLSDISKAFGKEVKVDSKANAININDKLVPANNHTILTVNEIAKKAESVVLINNYDKNNNLYGTGSGFIISADGIIVTNYHVIDKAFYIDITLNNNRIYTVNKILGYNKDKDIAILKIDGISNLSALVLGNSDKVEVGDSIVAVGSPLGLQNTVSTGIISSIRPNLVRTAPNSIDLQISAPISHGSSGGALFNMYGEVIGITYAGLASLGGENLNFAIPVNDLKLIDKSGNYSISDVYKNEHIIIYTNAKYEGDLVNGVPNGLGSFAWDNGDNYTGEFQNGKRSGKGTYIWASGDKYKGDFLENEMTGKGVYTRKDGVIIEGNWIKGIITGQAILVDNLGIEYYIVLDDKGNIISKVRK